MAELVDAPDSKSGSGNRVRVRVSLGAPFFTRRHSRLPRRHSREGGNPAFLHNLVGQIIPVRIGFLDEPKLPGTIPFLHLLLPHDGAFHVFVDFIPDERMDRIFCREAFSGVAFVLMESFNQIAGDANINRTVTFAGQYVYARLLPFSTVLDSRLRGNDEGGKRE